MDYKKLVKQILKKNSSFQRDPMGFMRETISEYALSKVNQDISCCNRCNIRYGARTIGAGNPRADILAVLDYPRERQRNLSGAVNPFASYPEVYMYLAKLGLSKDNTYFINTINCCNESMINDSMQYVPPSRSMIENCNGFMKKIIDIIHPKTVLLLGNVSLNAFKEEPISKARGQWFEIYCIPSMATYSPFQMLEDKDNMAPEEYKKRKGDFENDIRSALSATRKI